MHFPVNQQVVIYKMELLNLLLTDLEKLIIFYIKIHLQINEFDIASDNLYKLYSNGC